jgi:glycosyltransferase involved in cell wall biosynthesis
MPDNSPLVTVGLALYNGAEYIIETLNSINNQTYDHIEIVIVDDGSKDHSLEVCRSWLPDSRFPVSFLRNESNIGLPATRNVLICNANGKYASLFDQDDIMLPNKIENDISFFEKQNENVALIYSDLNLINERGEPFGNGYFERIGFKAHKSDDLFLKLVKSNFIPAPSVIVRPEILKKIGGYDETLQFDDWDMWLRLVKDYQFVFQDKVNVNYRIHNSSMMANRNATSTIIRNKANIRMFEKHVGFDNMHDRALYKKLNELSRYSYFLGDPDAAEIMGNYLKKKFDVKLWIYHKLTLTGIRHPSKWFKKYK